MEWHPEVAEYIQPEWFAEGYINREVSPGVDDFEIFDTARRLNWSVAIKGPTGSGKTSAVYAWAAQEGIPIYSVPCNGAADPSTLFGSYVPDEDGGFKWSDGPVTKLARYGGILLLNEVNFLPPKVAATLFKLLDKRRSISLVEHDEVIDAHSELMVVADYNEGYAGTRALNKGFLNRFALKLNFDYDKNIEESLVYSKTLLVIAGLLRTAFNNGEIETPIATNMLPEFETVAAEISFDAAIDNFINAFSEDEMMAVRKVFDLHRAGLESDYGVTY